MGASSEGVVESTFSSTGVVGSCIGSPNDTDEESLQAVANKSRAVKRAMSLVKRCMSITGAFCFEDYWVFLRASSKEIPVGCLSRTYI